MKIKYKNAWPSSQFGFLNIEKVFLNNTFAYCNKGLTITVKVIRKHLP